MFGFNRQIYSVEERIKERAQRQIEISYQQTTTTTSS
jgi:hypothetical protein